MLLSKLRVDLRLLHEQGSASLLPQPQNIRIFTSSNAQTFKNSDAQLEFGSVWGEMTLLQSSPVRTTQYGHRRHSPRTEAENRRVNSTAEPRSERGIAHSLAFRRAPSGLRVRQNGKD